MDGLVSAGTGIHALYQLDVVVTLEAPMKRDHPRVTHNDSLLKVPQNIRDRRYVLTTAFIRSADLRTYATVRPNVILLTTNKNPFNFFCLKIEDR